MCLASQGTRTYPRKCSGKLGVVDKPVVPILCKLKQEDSKFEYSLGDMGKSCLNHQDKVQVAWIV